VKDRTIAHAIIDSYSQASIKERSPEVHLFIEMPADALDVNVHPTKAEVRFRDQSLVHEVVRRAFMEALGQSGVPQLQLQPKPRASFPHRRRCRVCLPEGPTRIAGSRTPPHLAPWQLAPSHPAPECLTPGHLAP
jgi:DNA mismatch repair protein MutL